eukprot:CAMPEP_0113499686 /NCGR_PEP_ID=MMETSP0014_2-20120614/31886_1 /TAXON_ID=2857 /ORGANISM="Nitzschia sp." /LENGTH=63 /DNA_ID=CAMNT_0000393889 /DNA_START=178 /DNA_END=366 /DNA_ORIENTATION=- /assembly_acc=CAM_ASM_000159
MVFSHVISTVAVAVVVAATATAMTTMNVANALSMPYGNNNIVGNRISIDKMAPRDIGGFEQWA